MDFTDSTKVVYNRIQQLEPENVSKIIGYLLLQDHGEREMIRFAFCPDAMIRSLINKAKSELGLSSNPGFSSASEIPVQFTPYTGSLATSVSVSPATKIRLWENQQKVDDLELLQNQMQFLNLDGQLESSVNNHCVSPDFSGMFFYPELALPARTSRRSPSLPDFPVKVCHYFNKGFCKHGNNCRYLHGQIFPERESFFQMFNMNSNDEEKVVSQGSLEKLESEIIELVKSRRGLPVSIASLPMLYYEKYGKTLQAEGYLTESQRHGKAGYSLTKLLACLKSSIRVIDRPHGQHSVILAEDVPKFLEYSSDRNEHGGIVAGSRQIYLTFPAESTFTEQDVSSYFSNFGRVQDVRIPCQRKRMFGFVTFVFVETVKQVLGRGNPHFVCGARVLVKPYREKPRQVDRKYLDEVRYAMHYGSSFSDRDLKQNSTLPPRACDNSSLLRKQFGFSMDDLKITDGREEHAQQLNYLLEDLNADSISDGEVLHISTYHEQNDSQGLNLPESPFSSSMGTGISTVT